MLYCFKCRTEYEEQLMDVLEDKYGHFSCPNIDCGEHLMDIDENLVPVVQCFIDNHIPVISARASSITNDKPGCIMFASFNHRSPEAIVPILLEISMRLPKGFRFETDSARKIAFSPKIYFPERKRSDYKTLLSYQNALIRDIIVFGNCVSEYFRKEV